VRSSQPIATPNLVRLLWDGTKWTRDTANGWANAPEPKGKPLHYPDGLGKPNANGVTLATGDPNGVYAAIGRDDNGESSDVSRPGVLRFNVSGAETSLNATDEWDLTAELLGVQGTIRGPEAIAWVPDDLLVSRGFFDKTAGAPYDPASYPGHGRGLFFLGIEDGRIIAYALNRTTDTFTRIAGIASGLPNVKALEYEPESTHLWAMCPGGPCGAKHITLDIAQSGPNDGKFVVTNTYDPLPYPDDIPYGGFAIAPQAECVGGLKPVIWADYEATEAEHEAAYYHSLRSGTLNCTVPPTCLGSTATISGTSGNDTLAGTAGVDVIAGEGGDDTIKGLGGNDKICGGIGADTLSGFDGTDTLNGGAGADTFGEGTPGGGADVLFGGSGTDVADYGARAVPIAVSIDDSADDGAAGEGDDVRSDVENLIGGVAGDTLTASGSTLANRLFGRGGADTLNVADGIGGNDLVDGGADPDICIADIGDATPNCGDDGGAGLRVGEALGLDWASVNP
jgi:hypothetical protein